MNRTLLTAALPLLALAPCLTAQEEKEPPRDWRLPYRQPQIRVEPPIELFRVLEPLQGLMDRSAPEDRKFVEGVEVVDSEEWRSLAARLGSMRIDGGYLSLILRDSADAKDRRTAFFGGFHVRDPNVIRSLIEHIPGEPSRKLREEMYPRAVAWMRYHEGPGAAKRRAAEEQGAEPSDQPAVENYRKERVDLMPFLAVLELETKADRVQALWFLARVVAIDASYAKQAFDIGADRLAKLAGEVDGLAAEQFDSLLRAADPDQERVARLGSEDELDSKDRIAWFEDVLHDLYPPIRRISGGLYELFPSEDRDQLLAVGRKLLEDDSQWQVVDGMDKSRIPYRGLRLPILPEPLDQLGLKPGTTIVGISGAPVPNLESLRVILDRMVRPGGRVFVEFITEDKARHAIEYRVH